MPNSHSPPGSAGSSSSSQGYIDRKDLWGQNVLKKTKSDLKRLSEFRSEGWSPMVQTQVNLVLRLASRVPDPPPSIDPKLLLQVLDNVDERLGISLIDKLLDSGSKYPIYAACKAAINHVKPGKRIPRIVNDTLYSAWVGSYEDTSLQSFQRRIWEFESIIKEEESDLTYCKSISLVQSSGTGKSRLIEEFGRSSLCLIYTFRPPYPEDTGYPFGDQAIRKFMDIPGKAFAYELRALALVYGSLVQLLKTMTSDELAGMTPETRIKIFSENMAPTSSNGNDDYGVSQFRLDFCDDVVESAEQFFSEFQSQWYNDDNLMNKDIYKNIIVQNLRPVVDELVEKLSGLVDSNGERYPSVVALAFDEISEQQRIYKTVTRVLSFLKGSALWSFFLSTNSDLDIISPSPETDSSRIIYSHERLEAFVFFKLDVFLTIKCKEDCIKSYLRSQSLQEFSSYEFMSLFGRPLWQLFSNVNARVQFDSISRKLLGSSGKVKVNDNDHVFTVLLHRIFFEPLVGNPKATELIKEAVSRHIVYLTRIDVRQGAYNAIAPAEPVVAACAAELSMSPGVWRGCLKTFREQILQSGGIDKGRHGEMCARLLCILARDACKKPQAESNCLEYQGRPFKLDNFLKQLLDESSYVELCGLSAYKSTLSSAYMNFMYFSPRYRLLDISALRNFLHLLMMEQAALQLAPLQQHWDLMLPIYQGVDNETFDPDKLSVMLIQVKNRIQKRPIKPETIKACQGLGMPVIFIQLELGLGQSSEVLIEEKKSKSGHDILLLHLSLQNLRVSKDENDHVKTEALKLITYLRANQRDLDSSERVLCSFECETVFEKALGNDISHVGEPMEDVQFCERS